MIYVSTAGNDYHFVLGRNQYDGELNVICKYSSGGSEKNH